MNKDEMIAFRCDTTLKEEITELAKEDKRSLSDYIILILTAFIKKQKE